MRSFTALVALGLGFALAGCDNPVTTPDGGADGSSDPGNCASGRMMDYAVCSGACTYTWSSHDNCGRCGNACAADMACEARTCLTTGTLRITMSWNDPAARLALQVVPPNGPQFTQLMPPPTSDMVVFETGANGGSPLSVTYTDAAPGGRYLLCVVATGVTAVTRFTINAYPVGAPKQMFGGLREANDADMPCTPDSPNFVGNLDVR